MGREYLEGCDHGTFKELYQCLPEGLRKIMKEFRSGQEAFRMRIKLETS
jgi:hypothetical protein